MLPTGLLLPGGEEDEKFHGVDDHIRADEDGHGAEEQREELERPDVRVVPFVLDVPQVHVGQGHVGVAEVSVGAEQPTANGKHGQAAKQVDHHQGKTHRKGAPHCQYFRVAPR